MEEERLPKRVMKWIPPVSYTHLDVYKRQLLVCPQLSSRDLGLNNGGDTESLRPEHASNSSASKHDKVYIHH